MGNQLRADDKNCLKIRNQIIQNHFKDQLYTFGINENGKKEILIFETHNESFHFIDPPKGMPIFDYMAAIRLSSTKIYISGGLDQLSKEISPDFIEYDPLSNSFNRLSSMSQPRYTHQMTYFEGSLFAIGGRTYGEGINGLLKTCEQYDFLLCKWKPISPLSYPRSTFFTFQHGFHIYICGGYCGNKRRSELIERYDRKIDKWELYHLQLNQGIECSCIHIPPNSNNEFIIFGGNTKDGGSNECWKYNILTGQSYLIQKMQSKRILHKSILTSSNVLYIIGGNYLLEQDEVPEQCQTLEKCRLEGNNISEFTKLESQFFLQNRSYSNWKRYSAANEIQLIPFEIQNQCINLHYQLICSKLKDLIQNKSYSHVFFKSAYDLLNSLFFRLKYSLEKGNQTRLILLNHPQTSNRSQWININKLIGKKGKNNQVLERKLKITAVDNIKPLRNMYIEAEYKQSFNQIWYIFGAKKGEDYIGEINLGKGIYIVKKRPKILTPASYRNGVRLDETMSLFICGGINDDMSQIYSQTFRYFPQSNTVEILNPMLEGRYTFGCIKKGNYIYVLGGRTYGNDQHAILSKCERFNITYGVWEPIASMNNKRCSFIASCINNTIYVTGGYGGYSIRLGSFECYQEQYNKWELMGISLVEPVEASTVLNFHSHDSKTILILGGRNSNNDSQTIYSYDIRNGFDAAQYSICGLTGSKRCLHKQITLNSAKTQFILFGGFTKGKRLQAFEYLPQNNIVIEQTDFFQTLLEKFDRFLFQDLQNSDETLRRNLFL